MRIEFTPLLASLALPGWAFVCLSASGARARYMARSAEAAALVALASALAALVGLVLRGAWLEPGLASAL